MTGEVVDPTDVLRLGAVAEQWRPAVECDDSAVDADPLAALVAVLDLDMEPILSASEVPPFWHWLYFLAWPPGSVLGEDGHPADGPLLPLLPGRRRMFAGGRLTVFTPLQIGIAAQRTARVTSVTAKVTRAGALLFVTVRAEISQSGRVVIVDEQDLAYRSASGGVADAPGPGSADAPTATMGPGAWRSDPIVPDSRLLFQFSALTANSHRIHYDAPYATEVEGFAGLVVHGPLQAILLAEQLRQRYPTQRLMDMQYRFLRPAFARSSLAIIGEPCPDNPQPVGITLTGIQLRIVDTTATKHARAAAHLTVPIQGNSR